MSKPIDWREALQIRIQELANEKNITIHKLAVISRITPGALSALMRDDSDKKDLYASTILHICEACDIELWEFYKHPV